jgi:uncharacterized protein (TIGR03435 family)
VFFPNVSDTTAAFAAHWNELVELFAGKDVQFVLIARDGEPNLKFWLLRNPIEGWLLLDANWESAWRWGIELPQVAFVNGDGKILGFSQHPLPCSGEVQEILAGRVERAHLRAKPQSPGGDKPDLPPSYTVHISPTKRDPEEGTSKSSGPEHWTALGFGLKAAIADVYGMDPSRIDFPTSLDNGERYDFAVLLPKEEIWETVNRLLLEAIERHFRITIMRETSFMDVYLLTAPNGKGPSLKEAEFGGGGFMTTRSAWIAKDSLDGTPPALADLREARAPISNISGSGMTMADLCSALERHLDRPVVDETGLEGSYDFQVGNDGKDDENFFQRVRDDLGLHVMPGKRDVTMLVVRFRA